MLWNKWSDMAQQQPASEGIAHLQAGSITVRAFLSFSPSAELLQTVLTICKYSFVHTYKHTSTLLCTDEILLPAHSVVSNLQDRRNTDSHQTRKDSLMLHHKQKSLSIFPVSWNSPCWQKLNIIRLPEFTGRSFCCFALQHNGWILENTFILLQRNDKIRITAGCEEAQFCGFEMCTKSDMDFFMTSMF